MSAAAPLPTAPLADGGRAAPARTVPARTPRSILSLVPSPIQARRAPFVALLLVLLAGGLVALLLLNTASAQDAFKLHALQSKEAALAQDMQVYSSMGDGLDNPAILAARATALGMVQGDIPVFLARGAALPVGAVRVGDEAYIPGPPLVVPTPQASPSAAAVIPKAAAKPKTAVVPKTLVVPKTAVVPKAAVVPKTPVIPKVAAKPVTPAVGAKTGAAPTTKTSTTKTPTGTTVGGK
jgi:hypothetical protein